MKIIASSNNFEKEAPEEVKDFYYNFRKQRSPNGHKMKDLDYSLLKDGEDYYITVFRNIWKDASGIAYPPENLDSYNPKEIYSSVVSFIENELEDEVYRIIDDGDTGDFYSVGVKIKVDNKQNRAIELGEKIMRVLPYDSQRMRDEMIN